VTVMGVLVVPAPVRVVGVVSGGRAVHVLVLCRGHPEPAPYLRLAHPGLQPEWAGQGSNLRPTDYESAALTAELPARSRACARTLIVGPPCAR
jgi:hypothetical protein